MRFTLSRVLLLRRRLRQRLDPRPHRTLLRYSPRYHLRLLLRRWICLPCYVQSSSGAWHYLSDDPVDDLVVHEVLGDFSHLYFPQLPESLAHSFGQGGRILDVGAFNGFWSAEMLVRYPALQAVLMEPNPAKCSNLKKTLAANQLLSRARLVSAGLGDSNSRAWLVRSSEGSWGDWIDTRPEAGTQMTPVDTLRLAEVLQGEEPVVVKCNAEGAEFTLVEQAFAMDLYPRLMILMVHPEHGDATELWETLSVRYSLTVALDHATRPCWHARLVKEAVR